jgi:hypothetical protein
LWRKRIDEFGAGEPAIGRQPIRKDSDDVPFFIEV